MSDPSLLLAATSEHFMDTYGNVVIIGGGLLVVVLWCLERRIRGRKRPEQFQRRGNYAPSTTPKMGWLQAVPAIVRYWLAEATTPLTENPKLRWLSARTLLLSGWGLCLLLWWAQLPLIAAGVGGLCSAAAWGKGLQIVKARAVIADDMYAVASTFMNYRTESAANVVTVTEWLGEDRPQKVLLNIPPSFPSQNASKRADFEAHWKEKTSGQHSWEFVWDAAGRTVTATPVASLPTMVEHPGITPSTPWNHVALGVTFGGHQVVWDPMHTPHLMINGATGAGKSVQQRNILLHCLSHPAWRVIGLDPKMVELTLLEGQPQAISYTTTIDEMSRALDTAVLTMEQRLQQMRAGRVTHYFDLAQHGPAILVMIDEVYNLLSPGKGAGSDVKELNEKKGRCTAQLGVLARTARAAGIFLAVATQRSDHDVLPGETKNNIDMRIAVGRMSSTASQMCLDDMAATRVPDVKGRAILRVGAEFTEFQGYFVPAAEFESLTTAAHIAFARASETPEEPTREDAAGDGDQPPPAAALGRRFGQLITDRLASARTRPRCTTADPMPDDEESTQRHALPDSVW